MLKQSRTSPRTLFVLAALLLALMVVLCACGGGCDSRDSQGWCGRDTGHGTTSYSR